MLRLGASFVLAGVSTTAAELCVRSFINWQSNETFVGFYSVGFTLVVSYARIIFVAVDADYFPRLTAIAENHREMNQLINRQIDALVMLMAPFLITFAIGLPYIIRLLYTQEFLCVVPMVLAALCYMLFKAVYTPIAYLPLAKGDSRVYLFMELLYNSVFVTTVLLGYYFGGLLGAGLGLTVANLFDFLAINFYYTRRYQFRMKRLTLLRTLAQLFILLLTLTICFLCDGVVKYTVGTFLLLTSLMCSFRVWKQNK
jgi:O-antigen/teichoic acid export membrane protein